MIQLSLPRLVTPWSCTVPVQDRRELADRGAVANLEPGRPAVGILHVLRRTAHRSVRSDAVAFADGGAGLRRWYALIRGAAANRTLGPMMENGPTVTSAAISAFGSTSAAGMDLASYVLSCGSNSVESRGLPRGTGPAVGAAAPISLGLLDRAHRLRFAGDFAVSRGGAGLELPDAADVALDGHVQVQLVAGADHALEARAINAHEVVLARLPCAPYRRRRSAGQPTAPGLRGSSARHHGLIGKVPQRSTPAR